MAEKHYESLSALLDGETNEFELHKVLSALDDSGKETLSRYALVSAALQPQVNDIALTVDVSEIVASAIRCPEKLDEALSDEGVINRHAEADSIHGNGFDEGHPLPSGPSALAGKNYSGLAWGQMAIAASVVMVFAISFIFMQERSSSRGEAAAIADSASFLNEVAESNLLASIEAHAADEANSERGDVVSTDAGKTSLATNFLSTEPNIFGGSTTDDQRKRLNEYLLQHAGNGFIGARPNVVPYARLASFSSGDEGE